ncbi:MAG: AAA family ATPase, partial [Candidatus Micrarchaeota archaeon]|nr:AAA family ATPase [Candidatus Micrarchaeota archaeon]
RERKMREISSEIERLFGKRNELEKKIEERAVEMGKNSHSYERATKEMNEIAVGKATNETKLVDLKSEFESYRDVTLLQAGREELQQKLSSAEADIAAIGNVNMRAPEIYEERVRDIQEVKGKVAKLAEEKKAIENVIGEIDTKKAAVFMDTFNKVNDNFRKLFSYIMPGEAFLYLDSPSDLFNSGLHIKVRFEKNERILEAMSGGEKALVTLLLIFAMHMYRPAPFYILDEVEAALDKQNSKKLADLLKTLAKNTQLIVVTHNDQVLASADMALGVTKTAEGSKIVGIDLK